MEGTPLINGVRHSWASIKMNILGNQVLGVTAINYGSATDIQNGYGAGQMPVDRGEGNYSATASVTLKKYEVERITAALPPGGQLSDIPPFDIPIVFQPKGSDPLQKVILRNVQFISDDRSHSQGQTGLDVNLGLLPSHIDYN